MWALSLFVLCTASAQVAHAQTITRGYDVDESTIVQRGMIVGLKLDDLNKVEPINSADPNRIHGVVVGAGDASFVLAEESQSVFVASGGKFEVLVSDQNGTISAGDFVTASSVSGIGMKSDENQAVILGKAIDSFDGVSRKIAEAVVKDSQNNDKNIAIGRILVDISIRPNPNLRNSASMPSFLKDASEFIAGKPVNPVRVYMSLVVLIATVVVAGALIYSGVRSGMTAIGRNPLSKKSIIRGMLQVILASLIIFLIGLFGVYLLLRL